MTSLKESIAAGRQLGQVAPANTNATVLYEPPYGIKGSIRLIIVCNNDTASSNAAEYTFYHDADGNTASNATSLAVTTPIQGGGVDIISFPEPGVIVDGSTDSAFQVKTDTADVLTFTAYGHEIAKS